MSVFWRYFTYSVMEGRYFRSLNSPPFLIILDLFKSTIVSCKGPEETRAVCCCVLEIFHIFSFHSSRSLNSPPFLMIKDLFKSNIMLFNGPKEMGGACVRDLEIFCIFCFHRKIL